MEANTHPIVLMTDLEFSEFLDMHTHHLDHVLADIEAAEVREIPEIHQDAERFEFGWES